MHKEIELSNTTWWAIGGSSIALLSIGGYLWYQYRNKEKEKNSTSIIAKTPNTIEHPKIRQVPNWSSPFDMKYIDHVKEWLLPKIIKELPSLKAKQYAKTLKKAKGLIYDDEAAVKRVFAKELQDKTQVSSVSKAFWGLYREDLWVYLKGFLSSSELNELVTQPVKQLPNYRL